MTNKELNSHDLARELEIVKLQEENERLNGAIQTYDILLKSNIKANEELKSQLRGTTHCFDEEEHNKLKEEIRQLKKHLKVPKTCNLKTLEDYKSYYEDTTREQILEDTYIEYCAYVNLAHRYSELKKQLENKYEKVGTLTGELLYEENTKLINQQKEFINFLEDNYKETKDIWYIKILQKYKEIIGNDKK